MSKKISASLSLGDGQGSGFADRGGFAYFFDDSRGLADPHGHIWLITIGQYER